MHRITIVLALIIALAQASVASARELADESVRKLLRSRCVDCHDAETRNGGIDLVALIKDFDHQRDVAKWVKVEAAILKGKMPPEEEEPLEKPQVKVVADWFDRQFVHPGGTQHAGATRPRRLTREELQNTLEDILHVDLRVTVTNSRLHVIPNTVLEKFFTAGVIGESGFSNDAETLAKETVDIQTYARCFSTVLSRLDSSPAARQKLFGVAEVPDKLTKKRVADIIAKFGSDAYRRRMTEQEQAAFVSVYENLSKTTSVYKAVKSSFLAILLSPPFLYRFEEPTSVQSVVSGDELAVRLSYFLWSAPPDQTLRELAESGNLAKPELLQAQVRRMLTDPKRAALAENLGGEWFDYKQLRQQSMVNRRSDKLAGFYRTQYEEALLLFDGLIRFDQPIFGLVNADWAFVNRHQANIYRLGTEKFSFPGETALPPINIHYRRAAREIKQGNYEYKHAPLELVKLQDSNRGGFITLGPTMSVTSTENRTSPIRRGVWVMERILGEHFEVPEDVPDLEATQKKAESKRLNLSHNEILKLHSAQPGCSYCHQYIDPIGFGLEVYDQLGIGRMLTTNKPTGEKLRWSSKETPRAYADRSWPVTKPLVAGAETKVYFHYTKGRHRLDIRKVRLTNGGLELIDKHYGFTGNAQRDNVWFFKIPNDAPKEGWKLTAEIKGDGGNDSNGVITVAGPNDKRAGFKLPNGNSFSTPAELKERLLVDYREQFIDNVVRRVLAFALGRQIQPIDRPAIAEIKKSLKSNDYRFQALLEAVVMSFPFRHKDSVKTEAVSTEAR